MASLSAPRSISRFPRASGASASAAAPGGTNAAPEDAAAASRGESASHAATNSTTRLLELDAEGFVCAAVAVPRGDAPEARAAPVSSFPTSPSSQLASRDPSRCDTALGARRRRRRSPRAPATRASCRLAHPVDVSFCDGPPREAGKPARDPDAAAHDTRRSPSPSAPPRAIRLPPVAPRLGAPTGVAKANAAACDPISSRGLVPRCAPRGRATTKPERVYLEELAGFWP